MDNKPELAFVDHSFHKKTRSGDFLRDIFRDKFNINDYWDNSWEEKKNSSVSVEELNKYKYIFYFQSLNNFKDLKRIKGNIIWAPMYDSVSFNPLFWRKIYSLHIKVVCFSKNLFRLTSFIGIDSMYIQYFIQPNFTDKVINKLKKVKIFFWYRGNIKFNDIKKLFNHEYIEGITYLSMPDPGYQSETIKLDDIKKYDIKIIKSDFLPKEQYLKYLDESDVFISPRLREGIGMGFLEALASGKCIIGNDDATMNEYISDNKNGYLIYPQRKQIDFNAINQIIINSKKNATSGWGKWENEKQNLINFIFKPAKKRNILNAMYLFVCFLLILIFFIFLKILTKIKIINRLNIEKLYIRFFLK